MPPRVDIARVAAIALAQAEQLLPLWLPGGKRDGHEWRCGDLTGTAGKSCSVNIRTGAWSDFATGEAGGDLVALYAAIHSMEQGAAARALAEELEIGEQQAASTAGVMATTPLPKPKTEWVPVLPVPENAPPPPEAHIKRGRYQARWTYRDAAGQVLGYVYRFVTSDGGKEVLPCTLCRHPDTGKIDWRWISFPQPRPLYGLETLGDAKCILLVEGEKCADAARPHFPWPVLTWPGGGKAEGKADFSPLAGRRVVLWPDADAKCDKEGALLPLDEQPGWASMVRVARKLQALGCVVRLVQLPDPGVLADGWDVADAIVEGITGAHLREWVMERLTELPDTEPDLDPSPGGTSLPPPPPDDDGPPPIGEPAGSHWQAQLIKGRRGWEDCRENVMMFLLHHPELRGLVGFNEFAGATMRLRETPWGAPPGEWSPTDDRELGLWLAQKARLLIKGEATLAAGVEMAAQRGKFHPVRSWLNGLTWDETPRLEHWLADCLGVDDTPYTRLAGRYYLRSMVARVLEPGCKADHMLVLEGPQGKGKSTALRILAGEWFSDAPFKVGDKDSFLQLGGVWLYEISEMDAFNRAETTAVKAFVTQITDRFREPYGRRVISRPRQTMLAGTTNQDRYLRDVTGNRRFWPVRVGELELGKLESWREHLFAEAVADYEAQGDRHRWWPSRAEEGEYFAPQQDERVIDDPWSDLLLRRLEDHDRVLQRTFTAGELLGVLGVSADKIDSAGQMAKRIQQIMTAAGWKPKREYRPDGTRPHVYERPVAAAPARGDEEVPL